MPENKPNPLAAHGGARDSAPLSTSIAELPRSFGRYMLFEKIGQGGMAEIFLARATTELGATRHVVVKQILPELSRDERFAKLLVDEAKLAARLHHANIVQVFDLGREDDRLFIAMEYVEGFDLTALLRRLSRAKIPLPVEFALFIVREALVALDVAHRAKNEAGEPLGLVHRDVSPSNVLISLEGEIKLCDFGIARALDIESDVNAESAIERARVVGKSAYMAPEHARGEDIDARADLYAAAILLWELCAGRRLRKGTDAEMLEASKRGDVQPVPAGPIPGRDALQAFFDKALAFRREDRFANAAEMLRALDDYAASQRLFASQLRFGAFLTDHFADELVSARRESERAAAEKLDSEPPVTDALDAPIVDEAPETLRDLDVPSEPVREAPAAGPSSPESSLQATEERFVPMVGSVAPSPGPQPSSVLAYAMLLGLLGLGAVAYWLASR